MRPWRCDICLKFSSTSLPIFQSGSTCGGIHTEKRKDRNSQFLFTAQLPKQIWPRFSARPDLERSLTKTKKNYSSHPVVVTVVSGRVWYLTKMLEIPSTSTEEMMM
jgi:hypothetical protein